MHIAVFHTGLKVHDVRSVFLLTIEENSSWNSSVSNADKLTFELYVPL